MAVQPLQAGRRRRFQPVDQEALRSQLALNRQHIAQADSTIRTAIRERNESVAQALADGVPVAAIAAAAGVNKHDVRRRIGAGYTELQPAGWPAEAHLTSIHGRARALADAAAHKAQLEARRRSLSVMALKTDQLDLFEVASLAAVPAERIRSETRGITLRSVRLAEGG
ncbi:hypothetical protein JHV56_18915 [Arthrobacter sp. BHU FT2]|nr:hypothetical protein [Arthrobacter sp. BHU FT2]